MKHWCSHRRKGGQRDSPEGVHDRVVTRLRPRSAEHATRVRATLPLLVLRVCSMVVLLRSRHSSFQQSRLSAVEYLPLDSAPNLLPPLHLPRRAEMAELAAFSCLAARGVEEGAGLALTFCMQLAAFGREDAININDLVSLFFFCFSILLITLY